MKLKVLSWNIWVDCHFEELKKFLSAANADIIGLQEVKADDPERDVISFLTDLGYKHVFLPIEKSWSGKTYHDGPAIFTKFDIVSSQNHLLSKGKPRGAVQADIKAGDEIFHVFSTHFIHTHQQQDAIQDEQ